jgi:hypothetical protein
MTNPEPKKGHGLSVNELQGWAHSNLGRIWLVVVLVLATLSALTWWHSLSLILLGVGLLFGTLQPQMAMGLLAKGFGLLRPLKGTSKLVALIVAAVLVVVFPFLLTLVVGVEAGAHLVVEHKLLDLISHFRD